jgi:hypothetical protein
LGAIPVGGAPDRLLIYANAAYRLPFKVSGYFDLRDHEPM